MKTAHFSKSELLSLLSVFMLSLALFGLGACSTARKIIIQPGIGGTIAIPEANSRRGMADSIMSEVCEGKSFRVTEERESNPGTVVETEQAAPRSREEHFVSVNEWRITFVCE